MADDNLFKTKDEYKEMADQLANLDKKEDPPKESPKVTVREPIVDEKPTVKEPVVKEPIVKEPVVKDKPVVVKPPVVKPEVPADVVYYDCEACKTVDGSWSEGHACPVCGSTYSLPRMAVPKSDKT